MAVARADLHRPKMRPGFEEDTFGTVERFIEWLPLAVGESVDANGEFDLQAMLPDVGYGNYTRHDLPVQRVSRPSERQLVFHCTIRPVSKRVLGSLTKKYGDKATIKLSYQEIRFAIGNDMTVYWKVTNAVDENFWGSPIHNDPQASQVGIDELANAFRLFPTVAHTERENHVVYEGPAEPFILIAHPQ